MRFPLAHRSPRDRVVAADTLFFTAVGWLVVAPWTSRGWLIMLDWVSGPTATVTNSAYGLDSDQADAMPARVALSVLRQLFGAGVMAWLPILLFFPIAGVGMARLVRGDRGRRWAAGLAFVVNPFVFERLRAGHVFVLLGMALLPWLVSSGLAARAEGRWFRVRTAGLLALAVALAPHLWWIGLLALAATAMVPRPTRVDATRLVLTAAAAAVTTTYALVIQVVGVRTVTVGASDLSAYRTQGSGLGVLVNAATLQGFWRGGTTPSDQLGPWWPLVVAVCVAVAIAGFRRARSERPGIASVALGLFATGVVLGAGSSGPTGFLYRLAFEHLPMFAVMREAQKFVMLAAAGWAILFAFGVEAILLAVRERPARRVATLLVALPLLTAPTLLWGLGGAVQVSHYPSSWSLADKAMGTGDGSVLMLPWHQYAPLSFTDGRTVHSPGAAFFSRQVIASDAVELPSLRSASRSPRATYVDRLFARRREIAHLGRFLAPLGVQYVVAVDGATDAATMQWLASQTDLRLVLGTDDLVLYENTVVGVGRVAGQRTVRSFGEFVSMVEAGSVGAEAVFVDPTAAPSAVDPVAIDASAIVQTSPVRYSVGAGAAGWAIVPSSSALGWKSGSERGRTTVQGVMAFPVGGAATTIEYRPWNQVRGGYLVSVLALLGLFVIGVLEHRRQLVAVASLQAARRALTSLWARFRAGAGPAYLAVWTVATVAVNQWFRAGAFVATGDMGPFIRRGWQPGFSWSWTHAITGGGSAGYVMARWYEFLLMKIVQLGGGTDTLTQRLFYMTIYPMVALAVAACAAAVVRNRVAIAAAGSFAVLNGFFLTRLPNPLNVISVGCVAAVTAVGFRVAQGRRVPAPALGLAMLFMSFLAYNPPMLTVALAWTALGVPMLALLVWGRTAVVRILRYALLAAPWALLLNIFWLLPFAQAFTGGGGASATAQTDPTAWAWSQAQNNVPNVLTLAANWAWYKPQYLPFTGSIDQPWWIWLRYLLPVILFCAPLLALPHRRRKSLTLLTLVIVFTVLAKGLQPPFTGFNMFLYGHVPGFWLFREPMSKLGQLLILFDGLLIAIAIEGVASRTQHLRSKHRAAFRAPMGVALTAVLMWPYPLMTGSVIPDQRPLQPPAHVEVPSYWRSTASFIDGHSDDGKVLVLPLDDYYQMPTTWGFSGVDSIAGLLLQHPVLQRHPDGYFGDTPGLATQIVSVERALNSGDLAAVQPLLDSMGVKWIILRHDLVVGNPLRTFTDPATLRAPLAAVPTLRLAQQGTLDVYEVTNGTTESVRGASAPLEVPGEPAALADAVASLPSGQSVTGSSTDYTISADDTAANPQARSAKDGVWWPVPAVETGDAATAFTSTGGTFSVNQRSRARVPMVATEVSTSAGPALQLQDPTSILIDGTPVSARPATSYPLERSGVAVVRAGDRIVSLDGWLASSMPADSSASAGLLTLPIGSNTALTAWAPSVQDATLDTPIDVYDCNNYEPRPQSELRLQMTQSEVDGHSVVQLSAADHAACTSQTVQGATAGDTVRLRVQYRTVTGSRPQVCLLEVLKDGGDRCVFDARLRNDGAWQSYELVHTLAADVVGVRVVMYANVGLRLNPPTVSEYRDVQVTKLDEVLHTTAWPKAASVQQVTLTRGVHTLVVHGGAYGSVLAPFEPLQDCFRYDDATIADAQLAASVTTDDGELAINGATQFGDGDTIELRAKDHMACIASTMPDYGGAGLYEMEYGYRSVALRKPRVAIYHRGPNVSEPLPANGAGKEWGTYRADLRPTVPAVETRMYLYAPRDLTGRAQSVVQYRDVAVTPVASSSAVVLLRVVPRASTVSVSAWTRTTPGSFAATITGDGALSAAETFAPGWALTKLPAGVTATKVRLNGWQNGWVLHGTATAIAKVKLKYLPEFTARSAAKLSGLGFLALPVWLLGAPFVRRRRFLRRAERPARRHALRSRS